MRYLSHTPAPSLGAFVENLWLLEDAPAHAEERIIPSGTIELVVNLRHDEIRVSRAGSRAEPTRHAGAVVSGAYGQYFATDTVQHASIMGVHFRPGGAWPFLGVPAGDLADAHVDLEALWGRAARELRERLCAAGAPAERFAIMERALTRRLGDRPEGHGAIPAALREFGRGDVAVEVGHVAARVGLSRRRFIEVFRAEVGMTPKLYCRVLRFQRALAAARATPRPLWARLAPEIGYADQSHLVREFREFCGLSPTDCLGRFRVPVKLNHVPLTGAPCGRLSPVPRGEAFGDGLLQDNREGAEARRQSLRKNAR